MFLLTVVVITTFAFPLDIKTISNLLAIYHSHNKNVIRRTIEKSKLLKLLLSSKEKLMLGSVITYQSSKIKGEL